MKNFLHAGKLLLLDLASTILFLGLYLLTHNIALSVTLGMALGFAQISLQFARKKPIDTMEWLSLVLVVGSGGATLMTNDPRFVMFKPSFIYVVIGVVMLTPGWINRYLPPVAKVIVPDIAIIMGFLWSGLMFASAGLNAFAALNFSIVTWASFMPVYGIVSKVALFLGLRHHALRRSPSVAGCASGRA
jgi:intracellular septation protein